MHTYKYIIAVFRVIASLHSRNVLLVVSFLASDNDYFLIRCNLLTNTKNFFLGFVFFFFQFLDFYCTCV